jgi:hypothetical protein
MVSRIDVQAFVLFTLVSCLTYLFSHLFLLESHSRAELAKLNAVVIVYGCAQSFFGFMAGYCLAKIWYSRPEYNALDETCADEPV